MTHTYQAPVPLMHLCLEQAARVSGAERIEGYAQDLADLSLPILENASKFAGEVLSPLNPIGDRTHSRIEAGRVTTPPGFPEAYRRFREDGWASLGAPAEYGGQGLSTLLAVCASEMWAGANMAFAMCTELAIGVMESLRVHASQTLRDEYMPRIASGEWTTSMCLTEPQAGSDLSTLLTRAELDGDAWRLFGRKIYISWGDHDMAENIVHFVLARAPGAPPGVKGISLFLVPKKVRDGTGELVQNDIHAVSLEHKMGIRASPTCVMVLGEATGARGWLVGRLNEGLACMFTIMNHMRLGVGVHSLGLAERALQLARFHAHERLQGRDAAGAQCPIIEHADVRRMLLTMKSLTHALRCLAYTSAATIDVALCADVASPTETVRSANTTHSADAAHPASPARSAASGEVRAAAARRADFLTPIVKAWGSDVGVEVASLGVQIHGGTGYIDDAEISQVFRDARIGPIFEGTNYIQAQDLLGRKIVRDRGVALGEFLADVESAARKLPDSPTHALAPLRAGLLETCETFRNAAATIIEKSSAQGELVGSVAYECLTWLGVIAGGWQWAVSANDALNRTQTGSIAPEVRGIVETAAFYGARVLTRTRAYAAAVSGDGAAIAAIPAADI